MIASQVKPVSRSPAEPVGAFLPAHDQGVEAPRAVLVQIHDNSPPDPDHDEKDW